MKPLDLRRPRHFAAACAAVAAFAWSAPHHASAEVANPTLVPSDSAYVISVPNAPAFWTAWESNGLYDAFKKIMAMPEVEAKLANFRKEMTVVESSLGFKLDGKTMSQIFTSADLFVAPGASAENGPNTAVIFKVADEEKLTKLIDLAEKAAAQAESGDDETSGTDADDSKTSAAAITESEYQGVKIKAAKTGKEEKKEDFIYARVDGKFLLSNKMDVMHQVIDRIKTPAESGTIASSEDFKKVEAGLTEKGEVYVYGNNELALKMEAGKEGSGEMYKAIKSATETLAPLTFYGASIKFQPKEISSFSYGLLKQGTSDSIMMKNPGTQPLKVVSYVPENTLMTVGTSLFDAPALYKMVNAVAEAAAKDSDEKESPDISKKLKDAEPLLGFSVENDFIPALGNEIGFALNDVKLGGGLPQVDLTIMLGVKDKAKMKKVSDSLERLATNALSSKGGENAGKFTSEDVAGQTVKTVETQLPGLTPGYVLTDEFLIIGSTKTALKNALEANASGKNVVSSEKFKSLGHGITANANMIQFFNLDRTLDITTQIMTNFAAAKDAVKYVEAMQVMDVTGSSSHVENGASISHGVLKLK